MNAGHVPGTLQMPGHQCAPVRHTPPEALRLCLETVHEPSARSNMLLPSNVGDPLGAVFKGSLGPETHSTP